MKTTYSVLIHSKHSSFSENTLATFENMADAEAYKDLLLLEFQSHQTKAFYRTAIELIKMEFSICYEQSNSISAPNFDIARSLLQTDFERAKDVLDDMVVEVLYDLFPEEIGLSGTLPDNVQVSEFPFPLMCWGENGTA